MVNRLPARDELLRAHNMSVSSDERPLSATTYGRGAERIIELEALLAGVGVVIDTEEKLAEAVIETTIIDVRGIVLQKLAVSYFPDAWYTPSEMDAVDVVLPATIIHVP